MCRSGQRIVHSLVLLMASTTCFGQAADAAKSRAAFQKVCGQCHAKDFVLAPRSRDQWQETIQKMTALGAKGSEAELASILDYLVAEHGRPAISIGITTGRGAPGTGI